MGKVLLSNNLKWIEELNGNFSKYGFPINYQDQRIIAYGKMYTNVENSYENNGLCVICTGSWIYKEKVRIQGLKEIYRDFFLRGKTIKEIRKNLLGCYACILKSKEKTYVFVDETHLYRLYYYIKNNEYIITNTYYHVARITNSSVNYKRMSLQLARNGFCDKETSIENVNRVLENDILEIGESGCSICHIDVNTVSYNFNTEDEAQKSLIQLIQKYSYAFSNLGYKPFLFATGGLDSRLKLTVELNNSRNVKIGYWKGTDSITNGTENDWIINNELAKINKLETRLFSVDEDFKECIQDITESECEKYGEYVSIYAHNRKWLQISEFLANEGVDEIDMGFDPDILRTEHGIDSSYRKPYSVKQLINCACFRSGVFTKILFTPEIEEIAYSDIKWLLSSYDENDLSILEATNLFNYGRLDMGMSLTNFFNQFFYCTPLCYIKPIWDLVWAMPYEYKMDDRLSLSVIMNLNKRMLETPIYSHNNFMKFNKNKVTLDYPVKTKLLYGIKDMIYNTFFYKTLYLKYFEKHLFPEKEKNLDILDDCLSILGRLDIVNNAEISLRKDIIRGGFDLPNLCTCIARLKVYETINKITNH